MNTKYLIMTCAAFAALLAVPTFADNALARGHGYNNGGGYHQGYQQGMQQNMTAEQQATMQELYDSHMQKMTPLREQLWAKNTELDALSGNANVKPEEIKKLVSEIATLRSQMNKEMTAFRDQAQKETGMAPGFGGPGMRGDGMGHGMGNMQNGCPGYGSGNGGGHRGGGHRGGGYHF